MESEAESLAEGAETKILPATFLGLPAVRKARLRKAYRHEALDARLRSERIRTEARLLREARRAGLRTPVIYDLDLSRETLTLERLEGTPLTEILRDPSGSPERRQEVVRHLGRALGRLHAASISHGDLTGSNVLWMGTDVAFLDLSLGSRTPGLEEFGIDLHLVEEDLRTLCADAEALYEIFQAAYSEANPRDAAAIRERAQEIKGRVRYA